MRELIELAQLGASICWLVAAFVVAVLAIVCLTLACLAIGDRLERRRWAIRDRDDARRERGLLDRLAPAPPADPITTGRDRLNAAVHTPTPDEIRAHYPDAPDWPTEEDQ